MKAKDYAGEVVACLNKLFSMMNVSWNDEYLIPMLVYVSRFVEQYGRTSCVNLMNLLLASSLATAKFWGDDVPTIDYSFVAFVSGMEKAQVSQLEKDFLAAIDYAMVIIPSELERWRQYMRCMP